MSTSEMTSGHSRQFSVEFNGWERDGTRRNAKRVRLQVLCDGEHFQFFKGVVCGKELDMAVNGGERTDKDQYKRACVYVTVCEIKRRVAEGFEPLDEPHNAVEILVDPDAAERRARLEPDEPIEEGTVVDTWLTVQVTTH